MDILSDILNNIKLSSSIYFKSNFSPPWGMAIPKGPFAQFHIITRGQCWLKSKSSYQQLFAGDIIVFPKGNAHSISNDKASKLVNGMTAVKSIIDGKSIFEGQDISATLVCGHFEFDRTLDHPFINELPEIILIRDAEKNDFPWLKSISELIIQETGSERFGNQVIINKLGEVLFVHTLRAYIQSNKRKKGFIASFQDERISKVLKAIHENPKSNLQLVSLAKIAGMSRTAFSNRFKSLVGESAVNYLTNWRLLKAKDLLDRSEMPVGQICLEVGYKSEAAFNRLFKERIGITPLKYRQASKM